MKENITIDVSNSLALRKGWHEDGIKKYSRSDRTVYLSELPDGTLAGTEKMTVREYHVKQKRMRMAIDGSEDGNIEGLYFCESHAAVGYRAKIGSIRSERQYGMWVVWEEAGPRRVSKNSYPERKPKKEVKKG